MANELDLFFLKPELQDGVQVTVRRGRKWFDYVTQPDKPILRIKETDTNTVLARARVVDVKYITFNDIPKDWLELEHDTEARTMDGLMRAMKRAYPDFGFHEKVTVLFFQPIQ